jgi:iron complex transport system ATP-binding protein
MIECKNISLELDRKTIIKDISAKFKAGKFTAILGPNGAGKSSLLKCICGSEKIDSGEISLNNKSIDRYSSEDLALRRAVLSQNLEVNFPFSVYEIVKMGRSPYSNKKETKRNLNNQEIIISILKKLEIDDLINREFSSLSGGEKQRVQLARALVQLENNLQDEKFLFLDEPTSALDLKHEAAVMKLVKKLTIDNNYGIIAIIHDINLVAKFADEIIMLKDGKVIYSGENEKVFTKENLEKLYDVEIESFKNDEHNKKFFYIH